MKAASPHSTAVTAANPKSLLIVRGDREGAGVDAVWRGGGDGDRPADREIDAGRQSRSAEAYLGWRVRGEGERSRTGKVEARAAHRRDGIVGAAEMVFGDLRRATASQVRAAAAG